jgi:hypothetical protein
MAPPRVISGPRFLLANTAILSLVGAFLVQIAMGGDFWPFSGYRMYSTSDAGPRYSRIELVGIVRGENREVFLLADQRAVAPFDRSRLRSALERMRSADDSEARLERAARDILLRYPAAQREAVPLSELHIEEIEWQIDRLGGARVLRRERLATAIAGE